MFPSEDDRAIDIIKYELHDLLRNHYSETHVKQHVESIIKKIKRDSTDDAFYFSLNELLGFYCERNKKDRMQILAEPIFNKEIFCGAGGRNPENDHTGQQLAALYYKLDHAICALSGMQQNGGMGTKFNEEYDKTAEAEIERTVRDIAMALTGKRIKFVETLKV